ncbi:MAG TPA: ABC transporter ATP-binding protein [Polyangiaceae bacterium]|nr:ABC transporter ATP-binding protein [Polyangiaceae bacterium]
MSGGGGGWIGGTPSTGGIVRTFGLNHHFTKEGPLLAPEVTRARLRRVFGYFLPYWGTWLAITVCLALASGLGALPPLCVKGIIDHAILGADVHLLALLSLAMVGLAVAVGLVGVLQQSLSARAGQSITFDLRNELFAHLQRMSLRFYTTTRAGEIVSRVNNDVNAVAGVATGTVTAIVSNLFTLIATLILLFSMSWRLALISILLVPLFYLPSRIAGGIRRRLSRQTQESQAALLAFLHERLHVGGALLMNVFGQAARDHGYFRERSRELMDLNVRQTVVGRWLFMSLSVFAVTGPALVYWYGGLEVMRRELTIGAVIAFAALLGNLYRPLHQLATVYVDVQASLAVFERIFEYLDLDVEIKDRPDALALATTRGNVEFKNVSFRYPKRLDAPEAPVAVGSPEEIAGAGPFALQELSFEIGAGQQVAFVGPSGAGKTTVTYLLPRFYDVLSGSILLDGHDIRDIAQDTLRRHIGIVTQETFLFNASVRDNLLYAKPDATETEVVAAAKAANIHTFIESLPDGYDTIVGERGFRLSGGEKQRMSIARALLKNPSILILDEATSSLDATSEHLIQEALEKLLEGRTALIIAHRLSTILSSDKIVVLDQGRVVDQGTHQELIARTGLYRQLFEQQFSRVLAAERDSVRAASLLS